MEFELSQIIVKLCIVNQHAYLWFRNPLRDGYYITTLKNKQKVDVCRSCSTVCNVFPFASKVSRPQTS
jgi:hypothetical protein